MWKSVGLLVVGGTAAYTYVIEPAWVNWGFEKANCWLKGGVYVRSDTREPGYKAMMSRLPENAARLHTGEATGCLPEPKCALAPSEALAMIDRKLVSWAVVQKYHSEKLNFINKMHDGKGIDLPGDGVASRMKSTALLDEAAYCIRYLEDTRQTLVRLTGEGKN